MNFKQVIQAFENKQSAKSGNYESDSNSLFLFGNEIAKHTDKGVMFTLSGWNSPTTRKALSQLTGVCLRTVKGELFNNGVKINSTDWYFANDGYKFTV